MQKVTDPGLLATLNGGGPAPVPGPATQAPVFIPNAAGQRNDARDQTRTDIAVEGNARDAQQFGHTLDKDLRQGTADLRKEFNALPEVRKYGTIVQQVDTILHTAPTAAGDQDLLYAIAQLRDPLGSVREGDADLIAGGQSFIQQQVAQIGKQLNGQGEFTPQYRKQLREEAISRLNTSNRAYSALRNQFAEAATAANYDPQQVIGPHAGAAYLDRFKKYDDENGLGSQREKGGGFLPGATSDNVAFDMDTGTGAFGSELKADRLTGQQQAALEAFLRANAGNPNFGPESMTAFYRSVGIEGGAMPGDDRFYQAVREGRDFATQPNYAASDEAKRRAALEASYKEIPEGEDVSSAGRDKGLLLNLTDELRGGVGGIKSLVRGDGFMSGYERERDIERALQERSRQENGIAPELIGNLMTPAGTVSRTNMIRDAIGMGAMAGFGEGEGLSDSASKAVTGAGLGFGAAKGLEAATPLISRTLSPAIDKASGAMDRMARSVRRPSEGAEEYIAAADRQGVVPFVGDVDNRAAAAAGKFAQTQAGVGPITDAAKATTESAKAARDRIAKAIGPTDKGEGLGFRITEGAKKAVAREHDRAQSLYRTAERQSEGLRIRPSGAYQAISDEIDKIADTGLGDKALGIFRRVQDRMTQGPMTVETLRNIRTQIREDLATEGIRGGKADAAARRVMEAITGDVDKGLRENGMEGAANAFKEADGLWAAYTDLTDNVVAPLIGKNGEFSGEQVVKRLHADLRGNNARAAHLLNALPSDEQRLVKASVIESLGRSKAGQQGADGDSFSLATFLTHWNEIGDSAKSAYFGSEARAALNDLAKVAEGAKQSHRFANHSNSGGAFNAPIETIAAFSTAFTSLLATNVSARMLTSQRFTRWLAAAAKKPNAKAIESHIGQLSALARSEPVIANDIFSLQQRLSDAFSEPLPGRLAAEQNDPKRKGPPKEGERGNAPD